MTPRPRPPTPRPRCQRREARRVRPDEVSQRRVALSDDHDPALEVPRDHVARGRIRFADERGPGILDPHYRPRCRGRPCGETRSDQVARIRLLWPESTWTPIRLAERRLRTPEPNRRPCRRCSLSGRHRRNCHRRAGGIDSRKLLSTTFGPVALSIKIARKSRRSPARESWMAPHGSRIRSCSRCLRLRSSERVDADGIGIEIRAELREAVDHEGFRDGGEDAGQDDRCDIRWGCRRRSCRGRQSRSRSGSLRAASQGESEVVVTRNVAAGTTAGAANAIMAMRRRRLMTGARTFSRGTRPSARACWGWRDNSCRRRSRT